MINIMKNKKSFLNKKYKIFLFLPLAAIAVSYLIGATDISYILNVPMIMSPSQAWMSMQMGRTAVKSIKGIKKVTNMQHSNKLNLQSYVTCVECQNLPAVYLSALFYHGAIIKIILFNKKFYVKYFSSDIPHPPQNHLRFI